MRRSSLLCLWALAMVLTTSSPASAHTGFESSAPSDGETVGSPVAEIVLVFSGPAEPVGEGFVVRDPEGQVRLPDRAESDDGQVWRLTFDPAIRSGVVAVKWNVRAPDAHPIGGSFVFTVDFASAPDVPVTSGPTTTSAESPPSDAARTGGERKVESEVASVVGSSEGAVVELDEFLADEASSIEESVVAFVGRLLGLGGGVLVIGGFVFALAVLSPLDEERRLVLGWVVAAGLLCGLGGVMEHVAQDANANGQWSVPDLRSFAGDRVLVLRAGGGLIVAVLASLGMRRLRVWERTTARPGVVVGGGLGQISGENPGVGETLPPRSSAVEPLGGWLAVGFAAGVSGIVGSYSFDGHTVTAGHRLVTSIVDFVHVLASGVWAGGVAAFAGVLWIRHRRGRSLGGLGLALRFSVVAAVATAVAGAGGTVLAVTILDSLDALWLTGWGQILIAKTSIVLAVAGVGAYNHYRVIPWMAIDPFDDKRSQRLRKTVTFEAALTIAVVAMTAALVVASST